MHTNDLTATVSVTINASGNVVWKALTDPEAVKRYMFGATLVTDWKVGSPIAFKGEWKGKPYEDKGEVLQNDHGKRLSYTYWSSISGVEDKPENYGRVTYTLAAEGSGTKLTVTQAGAKDEAEKDKFQHNWQMLLESIKAQLDSGSLTT